MFGLGFSHLVVVFVLALLLIGPEELPEVARAIGRFLNELRRSADALKSDFRLQSKADLLNKIEHSKLQQEHLSKNQPEKLLEPLLDNETANRAEQYSEHQAGHHSEHQAESHSEHLVEYFENPKMDPENHLEIKTDPENHGDGTSIPHTEGGHSNSTTKGGRGEHT